MLSAGINSFVARLIVVVHNSKSDDKVYFGIQVPHYVSFPEQSKQFATWQTSQFGEVWSVLIGHWQLGPTKDPAHEVQVSKFEQVLHLESQFVQA